MTEKETIGIIATIIASYPSYEKLNETTMTGMVSVWGKMFAEDDGKLVELAVAQHIATSKWPPSIADIKEKISVIKRPDLIPPYKAWEMVHKALCMANNTFIRFDYKEILPSLAVEAIIALGGWETLCQMFRGRFGGYKNGDDRKTFLDFYKPIYEREYSETMMPKGVSASLAALRKKNGIELAQTQTAFAKAKAEDCAVHEKLFRESNAAYEPLIGGSKTNLLKGGKQND